MCNFISMSDKQDLMRRKKKQKPNRRIYFLINIPFLSSSFIAITNKLPMSSREIPRVKFFIPYTGSVLAPELNSSESNNIILEYRSRNNHLYL